MPANLRAEDASRREILTLVLALAYRALTTYEAVLLLCEAGYGAQALMLGRSLFEDMVDIHWAHRHPADALARYTDHANFSNAKYLERVQKYDRERSWGGLAAVVEAMDPPERTRLAKLYGHHGARSWTGLSLYDRVEAIAPVWGSTDDQDELRMFHHLGLSLSNETLHPSARTIAGQILPQPGAIGLQSGPSTEAVSQPMLLAYWAFAQILGLIYQEFNLKQDDFITAYTEGRYTLGELSDDQRRNSRRNNPCPCGSGKKFKHCHGA